MNIQGWSKKNGWQNINMKNGQQKVVSKKYLTKNGWQKVVSEKCLAKNGGKVGKKWLAKSS